MVTLAQDPAQVTNSLDANESLESQLKLIPVSVCLPVFNSFLFVFSLYIQSILITDSNVYSFNSNQ